MSFLGSALSGIGGAVTSGLGSLGSNLLGGAAQAAGLSASPFDSSQTPISDFGGAGSFFDSAFGYGAASTDVNAALSDPTSGNFYGGPFQAGDMTGQGAAQSPQTSPMNAQAQASPADVQAANQAAASGPPASFNPAQPANQAAGPVGFTKDQSQVPQNQGVVDPNAVLKDAWSQSGLQPGGHMSMTRNPATGNWQAGTMGTGGQPSVPMPQPRPMGADASSVDDPNSAYNQSLRDLAPSKTRSISPAPDAAVDSPASAAAARYTAPATPASTVPANPPPVIRAPPDTTRPNANDPAAQQQVPPQIQQQLSRMGISPQLQPVAMQLLRMVMSGQIPPQVALSIFRMLQSQAGRAGQAGLAGLNGQQFPANVGPGAGGPLGNIPWTPGYNPMTRQWSNQQGGQFAQAPANTGPGAGGPLGNIPWSPGYNPQTGTWDNQQGRGATGGTDPMEDAHPGDRPATPSSTDPGVRTPPAATSAGTPGETIQPPETNDPMEIRPPSRGGYYTGPQPAPGRQAAIRAEPDGIHANAMRGTPGQNIINTNIAGIPAQVNRASAPAFNGFFTELRQAGAPIHSIDGYSNRGQINAQTGARSGRISQHAYGNAVDVNENNTAPLNQWIAANRGTFDQLRQKYGIEWGGNWSARYRDPMHFEVGRFGPVQNPTARDNTAPLRRRMNPNIQMASMAGEPPASAWRLPEGDQPRPPQTPPPTPGDLQFRQWMQRNQLPYGRGGPPPWYPPGSPSILESYPDWYNYETSGRVLT